MGGLSSIAAISGLTIRIRSLERAELPTMLGIFSEAIPRAHLSRSIYLAPGAETFLARLLEYPSWQGLEQLWGLELEGRGLVGAAHTRLIGDYHHLNNYAVRPAFQNRGLGGRMMVHWHSLAKSQRAVHLSLDVALENEGARRHYVAFGFAERSRTHEYRLQGSVDLAEAAPIQLQDWPAAQASFQAYGFGRFTLVIASDRYPVDLRPGHFRSASYDPRLLASLREMDPARAIVVRTPDSLESPTWVHTGTIIRMTKQL